MRVRRVSDAFRAGQGVTVLVLFDEHRQPPKPELLVPGTLGAGLPIDVHVGADHPNEQASGLAFAHFTA
jgi:hypothetical protein